MKTWFRDNRGFLAFLLLFGLFRTAVADWNPIPSGSMRPSLLEGDVVLVNRLAYDLKLPLTDAVLAHIAAPRRGDIVTFSSPADGTRLIKRIVALPGDRVEMRDKQLFINGEAARYRLEGPALEAAGDGSLLPALRLEESTDDGRHAILWLPGSAHAAGFGPVTVPAEHFLMLGDNRDNSADSRYFGFVPRHLLIGRAEAILVSAAITENWRPRLERFGMGLH